MRIFEDRIIANKLFTFLIIFLFYQQIHQNQGPKKTTIKMDLFPESLNFSTANATLLIDSSHDVHDVLIDRFQRNRNIEDPAYNILIVMYSFLILFGSVGNCLVVLAVVRKPIMRTARNMFIVNLAVSGK